MPLKNNAPYKMYLESLLNTLSDVVIFLSPEEVINEISPLIKTYYSWKLDDVKGKSFESLYQIDHLTTPFSLAEYNNLRHNGVTVDTLIRRDNTKIHLSWSFIQMNPSSGFMLIGRNISEIKKLDIHHRMLSSQLEKISACVPGNFYWKNTKAQYLGCNDTLLKTLGLHSMVDIIGKTDKDLWPEQAEELRENDQRVIQTGETLFLEEKVTMLGKGNRYFTVIKMPLLDEEGTIIGILGNSLDITELKNTQAELQIAIERAEAANHVKTEFIANMGHDIRTPLTGIIGFSRHLESTIKNPEEKDCAKQIHDSGKQLLNLLNGVLDMITADSTNENNVLRETFDLHRLVQDVLELELPAVKAHHLNIETHIENAVPRYVVGDKMKLHRILLNLAGNAIKFTKVGRIELNAKLLSQEGDTATVEFEVKDTGIGIPDALQDKVFDRFFKVSPSYKGLYTGNGIGLHIAKKYVELLGGEIRLTSQEGMGTSFFFTLKMTFGDKNAVATEHSHEPIARQSMAQATAIKRQAMTRVNPEQLQVLLIEDNVPALNILQMMFKPFDVALTSTQDAESAFVFVQQKPFDLIISDIGLPKQSGDELAKAIRSYEKVHHRNPSTIIGLTGHSLGEITKTCLDSGMNEVYQKPMMPDALKTLMNRFIPCEKEPDVPASASAGSLGVDLPKTEEELFEIGHLPLLDMSIALKLLGTEDMARTVFNTLNTKGILPDLDKIKAAHALGDWAKVQALAHKMKAGSLYGTVRLQYAFLYMERYQKTGHTAHLEDLYAQMLHVIDETVAYLDRWLIQRS